MLSLKEWSYHSKSARNEPGMVDLVGIDVSHIFLAPLLHGVHTRGLYLYFFGKWVIIGAVGPSGR